MSEWLVGCPECGTRFRVLAGQLEVAGGKVRCGACLAVFRASERLEPMAAAAQSQAVEDQVPAGEMAAGHRHRAVLHDAASDAMPEWPEEGAGGVFDAAVDAAGLAEFDAAEVPPTLALAAPERRRRRWPWALLLLFGVLLATVQGLVWTFDTAALNPTWRPYYAQACAWLGCDLPQWRDPAAIRSHRLSLRPHPERPDALLLEAMIENRGEFEQPFPAIELQFADVRGRPLAARRFRPEEYLAGELTAGSLMPVAQPVRIAVLIENPGDEAVNYQIAFW